MNRWCKQAGWEPLLNTRGTTWRKLNEDDKKDLTQPKVISLLLANTCVYQKLCPDIRSCSRAEPTVVGFQYQAARRYS
ncbi:MAG: ArsC/Spx/MgsR family protein [Granulosicoccus sp.]